MAIDFMSEASPQIKDYLFYLQTVRGKSPKTVDEYFSDLRTFFRFIKRKRGLVPKDMEFTQIPVDDVGEEMIASISLTDAYEFMNYLLRERSNSAVTRARKCSSLKSFFNYYTIKKHLLPSNPLAELDVPKSGKKLPKYLTLEQSVQLLNSVDGANKERDYCILTLFLNCGMRLSELVGINFNDIRSDNTIKITGKGNKQRVVYLNDSCIRAINNYKMVRPADGVKDKNALFLSSRLTRISPKTVQFIVNKYLTKIGLDAQGYSCHKLRHTAATLMYQHGNVDIRVLQEILGHENLNTTEIYTHLSPEQIKNAANANPLSHIEDNSKKITKQSKNKETDLDADENSAETQEEKQNEE